MFFCTNYWKQLCWYASKGKERSFWRCFKSFSTLLKASLTLQSEAQTVLTKRLIKKIGDFSSNNPGAQWGEGANAKLLDCPIYSTYLYPDLHLLKKHSREIFYAKYKMDFSKIMFVMQNNANQWVQNDVSSSASAPLFHRLIWWSRQSRRRWRLFVQHSQPGSCTWTTCSSTFLFLNCFAVHVLLWHCSATGWSKETVTSNLFMTGPKNFKKWNNPMIFRELI